MSRLLNIICRIFEILLETSVHKVEIMNKTVLCYMQLKQIIYIDFIAEGDFKSQ